MTKSRKSSKNSFSLKKIKNTSQQVLPVVNKGLETIGKTTKVVVIKSKPYVEKGVSVVYDTLATGFNLGIKGAKSITNKIQKSRKNKSRKNKSRKSHIRSRSYRR
jgi:hypothetical protein